MDSMSGFRWGSRRRVVATLLLPAYLLACMKWQPTGVPVPQALAAQSNSIRIVDVRGRRIVIERPQIVGDSVIGTESLANLKQRDPAVIIKNLPIAVALGDIVAVEERRFDPTGTLLVVAGFAGMVALAAVGLASGNWWSSGSLNRQ